MSVISKAEITEFTDYIENLGFYEIQDYAKGIRAWNFDISYPRVSGEVGEEYITVGFRIRLNRAVDAVMFYPDNSYCIREINIPMAKAIKHPIDVVKFFDVST